MASWYSGSARYSEWQRAAAGQLTEGVLCPAGLHTGRECLQHRGCGLPVSAADRRLDQVHFGIPGRYRLVLEGPEPVTQRWLVVA